MEIQRIAAFSCGDTGGNPAGVVLLTEWLSESEMANMAAEIGYSETVFAVAQNEQKTSWRVRYFSPESEVPFCGHATLALSTVLGETIGAGKYDLTLNNAAISVEAKRVGNKIVASLMSPPTKSQHVTEAELSEALNLFNLHHEDLDTKIPPARIHGGADHIVLPLLSREQLAAMNYELHEGRNLMLRHGLVTIMIVFIEDNQTFIARNAFASGGVLEDPATGAAAAAFAGYLRDIDWPHHNNITIRQGEDMGQPSLINVKISSEKGSAVEVSGQARVI
ncbi:PhzF family phenazine biosynthesis protein [Alteromonas sp. ASW11-130]|uniref:PhzF family phenazine biosynthesis protein n=1 Tax=Alteromonas sp. ASW11-130 TaxID=3015775 RepID=UPI002241EBBC|nr:PhzF family phenazine biosynthesis protein [Alteromonas sp. ASW11-130]MCW8090889.1 PhzF family phenazine biosynthesis protein [Alteromonas sp. ASW11-130]